jgi:hypothetical protein
MLPYPGEWDLERERNFQTWFQTMRKRSKFLGGPDLKSPDPDDPDHKYDYRRAYVDYLSDEWDFSPEGFWPDEYRVEDVPVNVSVVIGGDDVFGF